jgi:hypothetical protein
MAADSPPPKTQRLPYREPVLGRDYWILDDAVPDPLALRQRLLQRDDWVQGAPYRNESWPGMRAWPALNEAELATLQAWMLKQTGRRKVFQATIANDGASLNHNCVQLVGVHEGAARPHTDSRALCTFAAVLYLSPDGPAHAGTSFFRVRLPDGTPGGNVIPARHANLVEALGTRFVPPDLFEVDQSIDYRFNRLLLYRADLIHSATSYFGESLEERRMTAVFFWMAK